MVSKSEALTVLIDEMDDIDKLATSLQLGHPKDAANVNPEAITKLRTWYLDWYSRCRSLLNDAGKAHLAKYYSGSYKNIHMYISNPAKSTYGRRSNTPGNSGYSTHHYYYWNYKYDDHFRNQFNEQRLLLMRVRAEVSVRESEPPPLPPPAFNAIRLHSRVRAVSGDLFKDGHFRQAILRACVALNEAVQQRSDRPDIDGTALMQQVFSVKSPVLKFTGHQDEQQGYMWLFSGLIMAIRNPRAHKLGETEDLDANEALEQLAVVSALFRALDTTVEG